ncbi:NAD(P)-dependent oxidoreductase [Prauserella halophila]|nr:NAD(P)-dependent oxidoreductase [Prauserella halophila]
MPVGVIGLGGMGTAYARRLLGRGFPVLGFDIAEGARERLHAAGGIVARNGSEVASQCEVVLTAVDTVTAFDSVVDEILSSRGTGWVIDTNTVSRRQKERVRQALARVGWSMLDCTVSGSPAMVLNDTYSFFVSGGVDSTCCVGRVIDCLASKVFDLGEFGNASTMKLIINHLLMVHNAAAAEAMSLGRKAGLPPSLIYDAVTSSGGSSRMFEIRGKAMAEDRHPAGTALELLVDKDGVAIADLARSLRHPAPVFAAAYQAHMIGLAQGWGSLDPSAMSAVYESLSGQRPLGPTAADLDETPAAEETP